MIGKRRKGPGELSGPGNSRRLGILLSGRGSNFQAICQAIRRGELKAEIACVISNVENAPGLEFARNQGLPSFFLDHRQSSREEFDGRMIQLLRDHRVDLVCLAGFMRLLSPRFVETFPNRILNIHPSLLPAFPGLHAQRQALEYGVKYSGCTVHFVDCGLDSGPIILQAVVPVKDGDTEESLSARILAEEHRLYCRAIRAVLRGRHRLTGKRFIREL